MPEQLELFPKQSVLDEANEVIYGDREQTYGHPSKNLECIGDMWTAYVRSRFGSHIQFQAEDVAVLMVLVKAARLANTPGHRDSLVDICGYAALVERCSEQA